MEYAFIAFIILGLLLNQIKKRNNSIIKLEGKLKIKISEKTTEIYFENGVVKTFSTDLLFDINSAHPFYMTYNPVIICFNQRVNFTGKPTIDFELDANSYSMDMLDDSKYRISSFVIKTNSKNLSESDNKQTIIKTISKHNIRKLEISKNVELLCFSFNNNHKIDEFKMTVIENNMNLYSSFIDENKQNLSFGNVEIDFHDFVSCENVFELNAEKIIINIHYSFVKAEVDIWHMLSSLKNKKTIANVEFNILSKEVQINLGLDELEKKFEEDWYSIINNNFIIKNKEKTLIQTTNGKVTEYNMFDINTRPRRLKYVDGLVVGYEYY